jgi:hypothetical protein
MHNYFNTAIKFPSAVLHNTLGIITFYYENYVSIEVLWTEKLKYLFSPEDACQKAVVSKPFGA